MVKLRSRRARLSVGGAAAALIISGLTLTTPGLAQAASCATANGVTGDGSHAGTHWVKANDGSACGNFDITYESLTANYGGYYKGSATGNKWVLGSRGFIAIDAGHSNVPLLTGVDPTTDLTVNNKTIWDTAISVQF
jgi:hypothetical protein